MSVACKISTYTLQSSFSSELLEQDAHSLVKAFSLAVFVDNDDSERIMVSATQFNKAMRMNERSGITHTFLQDMRRKLSNKRQKKLTDGPNADKLYEIIVSGYIYEFLVDERVNQARLKGFTIDKQRGRRTAQGEHSRSSGC